eukprot:8828590-Ditylum_brightwellii.AAC.1
MMYAEQFVLNTKQYENAYQTWLAILPPKTYQQPKLHFTPEYQLCNQMNQFACMTGNYGINFAHKETMDNAMFQLEEAAQQFAAANAHGQETMAQFAATNVQLQQQAQDLQGQMNVQMGQMMMIAINRPSGGGYSSGYSHGGHGNYQCQRQQYLLQMQPVPVAQLQPMSAKPTQWQHSGTPMNTPNMLPDKQPHPMVDQSFMYDQQQ